MKTIELRSITLRNWRGAKERTTVFNQGKPTTIAGGNGLGKSRHFDAFCWLLFGKDKEDRKDFELRTYDAEHNELHHCECSVEAVLCIDGTDITIKREFKEQWVKPRGQVEEVFKGNVTECTWDGVPVKVGDFQNRVSELIIDETIFKMITNPRYFTEKMKWQLQREALLQIAGVASDEDVAAGNKDFTALLDHLNGKSLSDYRKEIAAEKKRLKVDLAEIQPRIDQTQKMLPEAENWSEIEKLQEEAKEKINNLTKQVQDITAREDAETERVKALGVKKRELLQKMQQFESDVLEALRKDADEKNSARKEIEAKLKDANGALSEANIDLKRAKDRCTYLSDKIEGLEKELNGLREEWRTINASEYTGEDVCHHCGQKLPEEQIANARQIFDKDKSEKLATNREKGKSLVSQKEGYETELSEKQGEVTQLESKVQLKQSEIDSLYRELDEKPRVEAPQKLDKPTPEMEAVAKELAELDEKQKSQSKTTDTEVVKQIEKQRDELSDSLTELSARLQKREQIERGNKEIEKLEAKGREIAQQIADIEKKEYTAAQFTKKKIEDCEKRINSMFSMVRFKLFDYTQEGNEFETCVPLVNGTPYGVANTAAQVNAGLDIINTLCRFNNVSAPVFIDGAESVNKYIDTVSQMIFLQVTGDTELVIK